MPQHHLVIADTVQCRFEIGVAARNIYIVTHALIPLGSSVTPALVDQLHTSIGNLWNAQLAAECPPSTGFSRTLVRDIRTEGMAEVASTAAGHLGTATGTDTLPRQIAACLTVRTDRAGKRFRGRMYWGGFSETANGTDNHMSAATKTALDAFAAGFVAAHNVGGLQLGVAHRPTAFDETTGLPISPGLGFTTPAIQVVCRDNVWDSQRRRAA